MYYSTEELLKIAIDFEKEGYNFYKKLAKESTNQKVRNLYIFLQEQEHVHQATFEKMLIDLRKIPEIIDDTDETVNTYLQSLAGAVLLANPSFSKLPSLINEEEALAFALTREEEAVDYYSELKSGLNKDQGLLLDNIIKEEQGHVTAIQNMLEQLRR